MAYLWTGEVEPSKQSKETNLKAQRKRKKRAAAVKMGMDKGNAKAIRRRAKPK